ncbi:putative mediator of RNA polymerase II transcription subunit 12 [Drosophila bipectinata]|uniref:putative mediator of RNA polymerase II transcription subunit 12 n=1 Tax=Drosophila bipectinata TaxID=42026 RepID=UPI001C8A5F9D|nr:GATA zinc finger domain-containing protein 10 [Drosophila bipectinata]
MFGRHLNGLPWVLLALLLLAALRLHVTNAAEEAEDTAADNGSTESNEIIPREAIQKLDYSVRQALLRAIDKLEQEEAAAGVTESGEQSPSSSGSRALLRTETSTLPSHREKDEILEESTNGAEPEAVVPTVQFYTATFDERNAQEQLLSSFIDRSKLWKKTTLRKQNSPTATSPLEPKSAEADGPENRQLTRSVDSASSGSVSSNEISHDSGSHEIKFEISNLRKPTTTTTTTSTTTTTPRPRTTRRRTTTTTTTTTTITPRPTHNEDGENIELVDKQDIRIQEAPLVTAFTVDLDERGTAQKFRPLLAGNQRSSFAPQQLQQTHQPLQQHVGPTITKLNVLESEPPATPLPTQFPPTSSTTTTTQITTSTAANNGFSTTPAFLASTTNNFVKQEPRSNIQEAPNVNNYLIERQRALEQQIYQLKIQAQEQQALILRQLKLLEEQSQNRYQATPIAQPSTLQPQQQLQQPQQQQQTPPVQQQHGSLEAIQTALQPPSVGYSIRPSVEFIPSTHTKTVIYPTYPIEQQLPLRDAVSGHKFALQNSNNNANSNNNYQKLQAPTNAVQQIFQNLQQSLQKSNENLQVQPSNQFNFSPAEASQLQALPQHNYKQFQQQPLQQQHQLLVPNYVSNAIFQQQQQHRGRQFRQETGVGNFGLNNNVEIQPSNSFATTIVSQQPSSNPTLDNQNFYRQHLTPQLSNQLQQNAQQYLQQQQQQQQLLQQQAKSGGEVSPALNHGIPQFASQNLHFNGAF